MSARYAIQSQTFIYSNFVSLVFSLSMTSFQGNCCKVKREISKYIKVIFFNVFSWPLITFSALETYFMCNFYIF